MNLIIKRGIFGGLHYYIDDGLTLQKVSKERGEKLRMDAEVKAAVKKELAKRKLPTNHTAPAMGQGY